MDGLGSLFVPRIGMNDERDQTSSGPSFEGSRCLRNFKSLASLTFLCHYSHCLPCCDQSIADKKRSVIRAENQLQAFLRSFCLAQTSQ